MLAPRVALRLRAAQLAVQQVELELCSGCLHAAARKEKGELLMMTLRACVRARAGPPRACVRVNRRTSNICSISAVSSSAMSAACS